MDQNTAQEIREFIISNFLFGQASDALTDEGSLLENGIIDSTGVLELVAFLEQRFSIAVGDRELLPENLDSIRNATEFVTRKCTAQGAHVAR
jgi:acyl carrier protein